MNQGWIYRERVKPHHQGLTLLQFYSQYYRHSTVQDWQIRIDAGQILVDGQVATSECQLQTGQRLEYHRPPWREPEVPLTYEVCFDDGDLLVVAKPSGLPVLPGAGFLGHTLLGLLQQHYPEQTPVPVHRLGRGTSGLVLLARTAQARAQLSQQLRDRTLRKRYRTVVGPWHHPEQLTIEQPIGPLPHPHLGHIYGATSTGKYARSDCRVLEHRVNTTLLDVCISTGRPHQIRIHLAAVGYPLLGDPLYAVGGIPKPSLLEGTGVTLKPTVPGDGGYHLHAYELVFVAPSTGQTVKVASAPPPLLEYNLKSTP